MSAGDANLVATLVDRLATWLPHKTGSHTFEHSRDEVVILTRATIVNLGISNIGTVVDRLVRLLEELARPYKDKSIASHPVHVFCSEVYVLELLAECFTAHWESIDAVDEGGAAARANGAGPTHHPDPYAMSASRKMRRAAKNRVVNKHIALDPLDYSYLRRVVETLKLFTNPVPETYVLPADSILDDVADGETRWDDFPRPQTNGSNLQDSPPNTSALLQEHAEMIDTCIRNIVEYISFSNWTHMHEKVKAALRGLKAAPPASNGTPVNHVPDDERGALAMIRLISYFWVDSRTLSALLQEICGCYLHLRKSFQVTIAIVMPLLITRWLERNPRDFAELHRLDKRLDGGAETLFDMASSTLDGTKRKALIYPFQTSLLLLLPDVFEVASHMREVKSASIHKKVSFLDMLRKSLRNRNETAIFCLTQILRVARHFGPNSDAAILSFALDVHDDVREAVFRRTIVGGQDVSIIDRTLTTAVIVSLAYLSFQTIVENLAPFCLAPMAPQDFKVALVAACTHFARQVNADDYQPLFSRAADYMRKVMKTTLATMREGQIDTEGNTPPFEIIYQILEFLDAAPMSLFLGLGGDASHMNRNAHELSTSFLGFLSADNEKLRFMSHRVSRKLLEQGTTKSWEVSFSTGGSPDIPRMYFWRSTSNVIITVCAGLTERRDADKSTLHFIHGYLESRLKLMRRIKALTDLAEDYAERAAASTKMEMSLLIALCSTDVSVCQLVTTCISSFYEESKLLNAVSESRKVAILPLRNLEVWKDLASKDFRFTGLVAFQKRARGLIRQMQRPTAGMLAAWEVIFERWLQLSQQVMHSALSMDDKATAEWRNYSGLLASLAGSIMSSQTSSSDEPALANLRWIDRPAQEDEDSLLSRYLKQSVQLLASTNVRIREATREVLGSETSRTLLVPLLETLASELDFLFNNPAVSTVAAAGETKIVFAEQAAALLKTIVDRLGGGSTDISVDSNSSLDFGTLTLSFARFLNKAPDSNSTLRVKIKLCQLCEIVTQKKELLNLRHDVRIRNQLLDVMFAWIARPGSPKLDHSASMAGGRAEEAQRLQRDLDRSCLKALADLTFRLPLQPAEGQSDADTSDLKSEMFRTYFNRFLSLLNHEAGEGMGGGGRLPSAVDEGSVTSELAITALSNLLSANIDVGLKHSLGIGYHVDIDIRTAFVKVLCNILIQGTEFNNLSDTTVNRKYDELLELLLSDMDLTISLCDACPASEVDEMSISLLNIFDSRGLGFDLVQALMEHEVDETENEAELLRRNCVATKILSIYAKWKGGAYLRSTLQQVLERLIASSSDLDLELDPTRTKSQEEHQKNALQLRVVTNVFIDDICSSAANIPPSLQRICSIISNAVQRRFDEAMFTAVGSFIFLRFFCPAIVAPDAEGLVSSIPTKEMRRGLLLIAKVVQNLANNVLFGAKEPYMFALNDFLAQNIYRVTAFLREISVPPTAIEPTTENESFDFGSCVALHRFLYDNWDHLKQKLLMRERKGASLSPLEISKGHVPLIEDLRKLITNLGPPPTDVSWNRPTISQNSPPSYSRFQHFMLKNAGRSTESIISSRAVYDGGESKDGMSMICINLRSIEPDNVDFDLLLFVFLKIASRMWHRSFGIFVDATCYAGQNEPQDSLFKKLDSLTPTELSKNLSRFYVYNMNSAFRKCFRRMLRVCSKNESSAFHPRNLDYHLLGNMQDLQTHFHLSQLHLPKETISAVADTRFLFQPVTRLSKTKGKIDVIIKIGPQYVQVTTAKKQEVVQGLRLHATVNDIFRLSDVDEAPTTIQTEDDSAFGLRTDSGRIVMYFTSPKKSEILRGLRDCKAAYSKEMNTHKSFERLIRPQDVPGTLLNIAFTNMASTDQTLRLASYNLLCALCRAFKFAANSRFMTTQALCVPLNPSNFIIDISQQLARSEPRLTVDFLNEFFVGWESFPRHQRPLSLAYMAPWLPSLRTNLIPDDTDSDKAREKVALIFRKLIEIALSDVALSTTLEHSVWSVVCRDELYIDIFLEEIVKMALNFGEDDKRTEILGSIIAAMGTITIRGKLLSRLRKSLNRTSLRPTRHLPENTVWNELCILLRLCLCISFDSAVQSQLYVPEIFHLVTMLANTGPVEVRLMVHRLLVNTIHAMCTTFPLEEDSLGRLKVLLATVSEQNTQSDSLFHSTSSMSPADADVATATESIAALLSEITLVAAPTMDLSNAWRARWMSLVASTAFQSNPAIQPRAFTVMGCLAKEDVDDDLLYQVLVALKSSVMRFMEDNDSEMLVAIISALNKMMDKLSPSSRYGLQLFWLALSLVRLVPIGLFNCTASFLDAVLTNIATSGELGDGRMVPTLLAGRAPLEDAALQLDELYGIHYNNENFHYAISATLVKGLTDVVTRPTAVRVMSTFLTTTITSMPAAHHFPFDTSALPYLGLLMSRAMTVSEAKDLLWMAGLVAPEGGKLTIDDAQTMIELETVKDKELLLMAAVGMVDFRLLDDTVQIRMLRWLGRMAVLRSTVILHLSGPVMTLLDEVIMTGQNAATLEAAHHVLRLLTSNPKFSSVMDTTDMLEEVLEGVGFGGLWRSSSFYTGNGRERQCTTLTDRLIEQIIA